ncbi:MAG: hypothetical protein JWM64_2615, partial [Frankiales bacterium]|nr:hypothetical protein [Frankiales bacterium]
PVAATLPTTGVSPALAAGAAVLVAGAAVATKAAQSAGSAEPA